MSAGVIAVGNEFRRDDGVGPAVVAALADRVGATVRLVVTDGDPVRLLEAWQGLDLAVLVDASLCEPPMPGHVHRTTIDRLPTAHGSPSSHGLGIPEAVELARVLDRMPRTLVVYSVEAAAVDFGVGLCPEVAAAVPKLVEAVLRELGATDRTPL
ncbi:hydrogenase maturation protease [Allokutzneria oryzae]|uniref:Hydrogenase maturation protease n=1 Tax=Allokutzneria oryzae TaxID=1378989 RepID=A0ABV5ZYE3_9PSEU